MKSLLKTLAYAFIVIVGSELEALRAQGRIEFNNRVIGTVVAPIYGVNPSQSHVMLHGNAITNGGTIDYTGWPLLVGTGFSVALYAGVPGQFEPEMFTQMAVTTFRTQSSLGGFLQPPSSPVIIPWVIANNEPIGFQLRAWNNQGGTVNTWAAALAYPYSQAGYSDVFIVPVSTGMVPSLLVGLTSFNLIGFVPEPSAYALLAVGTLVVWAGRRKLSGK
jgi:hypothetical protein